MAETYVLQAVQNGLQVIQQNPTLLSRILDALSSQEQQSAQNYFATAKIKVAPGFPMSQADLPFIGVTVANAEQDIGKTPIGWHAQILDNGDGTSSNVQTVRFNGVIKSAIYTSNADLIVWLSEIVAWCLFTNANVFTNADMGRIQVSIGDYEPSPDFLPTIFTFARGITLSCVFGKTFVGAPVQNATSENVTTKITFP